MGNEGSRPSPLRRSSSRRQSKSANNQHSGHQYIAEDEVDKNNDVILQTPKPMKRMDKIRRSLSFRKKKKSDESRKKLQSQTTNDLQITSAQANMTTSNSAPNGIVSKAKDQTPNAAEVKPGQVVKPPNWIEDEKKVRAGNCSFQVKYLGTLEVSDSRGMHLCETAIEKLLAEKEKKKPIKAILYVSGDSLRVVDEANKTLLVDQTIEKVSFCAPDRHHENGFAYICRDGTTRRWLCYCFMAIKDTLKGTSATGGSTSSGGERLSHAVGCAFSVCLEKKQKREKENVSMEVGPNHSFSRFGSFRQASLTERIEDPQMVMPAAMPVPIKQFDNPHAIARPKANPDAFTRQNSLRGTGTLQLPFKRNTPAYTSLRPGELPSFQQQKAASGLNLNNNPITKTSLLMQQHQQHAVNNYTADAGNLNSSQSYTSNIHEQNKINTINELPEDLPVGPTTQTSPVSNNMHIKNPQTTSQEDWANINNVFPTPQSKPVSPRPTATEAQQVTNTITPPPLPPMPSQYTTPQNVQQQQQKQLFAQKQHQQNPVSMQNMPLQQQFNLMSMTPNQLSYAGSQSPSYTASVSSASSFQSPVGLTTPNPNETFEQKWARIQAAKKTNPFAEDIAKKFEIKLT